MQENLNPSMNRSALVMQRILEALPEYFSNVEWTIRAVVEEEGEGKANNLEVAVEQTGEALLSKT